MCGMAEAGARIIPDSTALQDTYGTTPRRHILQMPSGTLRNPHMPHSVAHERAAIVTSLAEKGCGHSGIFHNGLGTYMSEPSVVQLQAVNTL